MTRLTQRDCYRPNVRYEDLHADRLHQFWLEEQQARRRERYLHWFLGTVLIGVSLIWLVCLVICAPRVVSYLIARL